MASRRKFEDNLSTPDSDIVTLNRVSNESGNLSSNSDYIFQNETCLFNLFCNIHLYVSLLHLNVIITSVNEGFAAEVHSMVL